MDLTILIPVKNEEDNISNIIYNIEKKLFNLNYEVLFVNDFSTDKTVEIINNYKNLKKNIEIVHNKKIGLGETIKNGIKFSKGEYLSIIMSKSVLLQQPCVKDFLEMPSDSRSHADALQQMQVCVFCFVRRKKTVFFH